jgi:hypothetical protein
MKVRVFFCREPDAVAIILNTHKISSQGLITLYELVWECEFKNILNAGRIWLGFRANEEKPFGIPIREKRSHATMSPGDIIQIINDFYLVNHIGTIRIEDIG